MINFFLPRTINDSVGVIASEISNRYFERISKINCLIDLVEIVMSDSDHITQMELTVSENINGLPKILFDILNVDNTDHENGITQLELEKIREEKLKNFVDGMDEVGLCKLIVSADINGFNRNKVKQYISLYETVKPDDKFYDFSYIAFKTHDILQNDPTVESIKTFLSKFDRDPVTNSSALRAWYDLSVKTEYDREFSTLIMTEMKELATGDNRFDYFWFRFLFENYVNNDLFQYELRNYLSEGFEHRASMIKGILYPNYHCFLLPFLTMLKKIYHYGEVIPPTITFSSREKSFFDGVENIEDMPGYYPGIK